ncbi:MAG: hypothetical protein QM776_16885 [Rhodocyclaceae bacterium]
MFVRPLLWGLLVFVGLLELLVSDWGSEISSEIARQHAAGIGRLDLTKLAGPNWTRVCFLGPYAVDVHAQRTLGFSWDVNARTSFLGAENINVVIFATGSEVVDYTEHPRTQGELLKLSGKCFPRSDAVFIRNEDGYYVHHTTS